MEIMSREGIYQPENMHSLVRIFHLRSKKLSFILTVLPLIRLGKVPQSLYARIDGSCDKSRSCPCGFILTVPK